jgi:hypothetical protein
MYGETIQEDQGRNLKEPKQYKAPLVLYMGVDYEGLNSAVTITISARPDEGSDGD